MTDIGSSLGFSDPDTGISSTDTFSIGSGGDGYDAFSDTATRLDSVSSDTPSNIDLPADSYYVGPGNTYVDDADIPDGYKKSVITDWSYNGNLLVTTTYTAIVPDPDYVAPAPAPADTYTVAPAPVDTSSVSLETPVTTTVSAADTFSVSPTPDDSSTNDVFAGTETRLSTGGTSSNDAKTTTKATNVATKKATVAEPTTVTTVSGPGRSPTTKGIPGTSGYSTLNSGSSTSKTTTSGPGRSPTTRGIPGTSGYDTLDSQQVVGGGSYRTPAIVYAPSTPTKLNYRQGTALETFQVPPTYTEREALPSAEDQLNRMLQGAPSSRPLTQAKPPAPNTDRGMNTMPQNYPTPGNQHVPGGVPSSKTISATPPSKSTKNTGSTSSAQSSTRTKSTSVASNRSSQSKRR